MAAAHFHFGGHLPSVVDLLLKMIYAKKLLLFKELPLWNNRQHPKSCEKEKIGNVGI
jgi:hypothetical protein